LFLNVFMCIVKMASNLHINTIMVSSIPSLLPIPTPTPDQGETKGVLVGTQTTPSFSKTLHEEQEKESLPNISTPLESGSTPITTTPVLLATPTPVITPTVKIEDGIPSTTDPLVLVLPHLDGIEPVTALPVVLPIMPTNIPLDEGVVPIKSDTQQALLLLFRQRLWCW
jgi:hypothetical protein